MYSLSSPPSTSPTPSLLSSRPWSPSPRPSLLALPDELLALIALFLATAPPNLGPPAVLPLQLTCRRLYAQFGDGNKGLWRRIARAKFSFSAISLSLFPPLSDSDGDVELSLFRAHLLALRVIRAGDVHSPSAAWALRTAYAMLVSDGGCATPLYTADPVDPDSVRMRIGLSPGTPSLFSLGLCSPAPDCDSKTPAGGKNRRQLAWAGAAGFAMRFVRERLYEGRYGRSTDGEENEDDTWTKGWPLDTEERAAALWVIWFFEDGCTLRGQNEQERRSLQTLLLPYIVAPFRYPSTLCPPHHYTVPLLPSVLGAGAGAITVPTNHGPYPIYALGTPSASAQRHGARASRRKSRSTSRGHHHNHRNRLLLTAPPARLLFFSRIQVGGRMGVPPHLPRDRAEADARWLAALAEAGGQLIPPTANPTQADVHERNARPVVRFEAQTPPGAAVDFWGEGEEAGEAKDTARWAAHAWRGLLCGSYEGKDGEGDERPRQGRGGAPPGRIGRVYELGSFAGLWCGTMLLPSEQPYVAMIARPGGEFPADGLVRDDFIAAARPMYMRITEHHSFYPQRPVPPPRPDETTGEEGMRAGWLSAQAQFVAVDDGQVEVRGAGEESYVYETLRDGRVREGAHKLETCPGCVGQRERERAKRAWWAVRGAGSDGEEVYFSSPSNDHWPEWDAPAWAGHQFDQGWEPTCDGVQDVVFSGETDSSHGTAWHHYEFSGRVRPWDGLIGVVMRPRNRTIGLATYFISGHVVGRDTFEGTWQMAGQDVLAPSWGGSICFARGEE